MGSSLDFENRPATSIIILTSVVTIILSIIGFIILPNKYLVLSFIIGVIASILGFLLSVYRTDIIIQERVSKPVIITTIGFVINYLIYGIALYISMKIVVLNIFACLAGILLMKLIIYMKYGFLNLKQHKKHPKKEGDMIE